MAQTSNTARAVIAAVMQEVQAVAKNDRNEAQRFNFRGIDAVVNKVGPALRNAGGFIVPDVISTTHDTMPAKNGGSMSVVRLTVQFSVYGAEGDPIIGTVAAEAFDSGDKATNKATSASAKYALIYTLSIPTEDNSDADAESNADDDDAVVVDDDVNADDDDDVRKDLFFCKMGSEIAIVCMQTLLVDTKNICCIEPPISIHKI
jgi:hypothetical protein